MRYILLFFVIYFCLIPISFSKTKRENSKKGKVVKVNFDDELLIKGKFFGPSLFTLYQKKNVEFGKLIKPRKNFLQEMRVTRGDIEPL